MADISEEGRRGARHFGRQQRLQLLPDFQILSLLSGGHCADQHSFVPAEARASGGVEFWNAIGVPAQNPEQRIERFGRLRNACCTESLLQERRKAPFSGNCKDPDPCRPDQELLGERESRKGAMGSGSTFRIVGRAFHPNPPFSVMNGLCPLLLQVTIIFIFASRS